MNHRAAPGVRLTVPVTLLALALLATSATAQLVTIPIVNAGFEQPATADDSRNFTTSIPGWTFTAVGSYVDDGVTNPGPSVDDMLLPLPEGDQALIIQEATLEQPLSVAATIGACTLEASVYVEDLSASTNSIRVYAGTHLLLDLQPNADGQWLTLQHTFVITGTSNLVGQPLRIEIDQWANPNKFTYWDDISLVCDPNPGCVSKFASEVISHHQGYNANGSHVPADALGDVPTTYYSSGDGGWIRLGFGCDFSTSGDSQGDVCLDEFGNPDCYTLKLRPADQFTANALQAAGYQSYGGFYWLYDLTLCGDANVDLDALLPGYDQGELQFDAIKVYDDGDGGNGYELASVEVKFVCLPPQPTCVPEFASQILSVNQGPGAISDDGPAGALGDDSSTFWSAGDGGDITLAFTHSLSTSGDGSNDLCVDEWNNPDCYHVLVDPATALTDAALQAAGLSKSGDFYDLGQLFCGDENIDIDALVPGHPAEELRFAAVRFVDDGGGNGHEISRVEAKFVCTTPDPEYAKLGDRVWVDVDCDGIQDGDESGLPNVMVQLRDTNGTVIDTTTTDASGHYQFCVAPGTYLIKVFPAPDRFFLTTPGVGNDPGLDSDFDETSRLAGPYAVGLNDVRDDIDAGACVICTGVTAFADNNLPACGLPDDPVMTATVPALGSIWTLSVESDFPNSTIFVFFAPGGPYPLQVPGSTCFVYPDLTQLILLAIDTTDANGDWSVSGVIPPDPIMVGIEFTFQSRVCDPSQQGPIPGIPDFPSNASHVGIGCP